MIAGKLKDDRQLVVSASEQCLKVDPFSWNVNEQWLAALEPQWDGSVDAMSWAVDGIRKRIPGNAALGRLLARPVAIEAYAAVLDAPNSQQLMTETLPVFEGASVVAPDPSFLGQAGIAESRVGNPYQALGYLSQALRFSPTSPTLLLERAEVRKNTDDASGAVADARSALSMDDSWCGCWDGFAVAKTLVDVGLRDEARAVYARVMKPPSNREAASIQSCQTYVDGEAQNFDREHLLDCSARLVAEYPYAPYALQLRAWALYKTNDPSADAIASRYRAAMDPTNDLESAMDKELQVLSAEMHKSDGGNQSKR